MAPEGGAPLPSAPADEDEEDDEEEPSPPAPRPRPPGPMFSWKAFVYIFLGMLGFWMLIDGTARNQIAGLLGVSASSSGPLYYVIGFGSTYLFLTMALAGALEMLITSLAYNYTTDWIKAAKVQKWSSAFRKVQMEAIRSGKKDRIAALKPHQERLARLSGEVSIGQFKGMAITYFLLILIYTWVGLVIGNAPASAQVIALHGSTLHLTQKVVASLPVPWWFLIFSIYTIPFSMVFRRLLKHWWLLRYLEEHPPSSGAPTSGATGGSA
ncbi:MAG TPA: EMC3/TMCO1 family protein [Thermoplasmata archaeon]|nr:EMC3/TMCO1 family protein [Thermoplasmata archaeon]